MYRAVLVLAVLLQIGCTESLTTEKILLYPGKSYDFKIMQQEYDKKGFIISEIKINGSNRSLIISEALTSEDISGINSRGLDEKSFDLVFKDRARLMFQLKCSIRSCRLYLYQSVKPFSNSTYHQWVLAYYVPSILKSQFDDWVSNILATQYNIYKLP